MSDAAMSTASVVAMLESWLQEDAAGADVTSAAIVDPDATMRCTIRARQAGVVAGLEPLARAIAALGVCQLVPALDDGAAFEEGADLGTLSGPARAVLALERTLLNALGMACGIATRTAAFVAAIEGHSCEICDTRKTPPGLRDMAKHAVACGGGTPHRRDLSDAALFKDNHLAGVDDLEAVLRAAVSQVRASSPDFVEIEVDTIEQLTIVLAIDGIDMVLLDNMLPDLLREAVALRDSSTTSPLLEASGGVTLEIVADIAESGVDRIAIGALTAGTPWVDLALDTDA